MTRTERLVHDEEEPCPYRPGQEARMPLRWQLLPLSPEDTDQSLAEGDRRVGHMLYRTACRSCTACEPIRIPVRDFRPTRSQRRVIRRNRDVRVAIGPATFSEEKLALYNRHKQERGLAMDDRPMTERGYRGWFVESCVETVEMRYLLGDRLVGVGILDLGRLDASSVYFFFDPDESRRSLGVFSVLVETAWLRLQGGRHHYLGLYVADCGPLAYKARYFPHERLIDGRWWRFDSPDAAPRPVEAGAAGEAP